MSKLTISLMVLVALSMAGCGGGGGSLGGDLSKNNETNLPPVPAPTLTSISPSSGSQFGGTPITLTGSGFQPGAVVGMRTEPDGLFIYTDQVTIVKATSLTTFSVTAGSGVNEGPTPAEVVVVNPDGQSSRLGGTFTWTASNSLPPKAGLISDPAFLVDVNDPAFEQNRDLFFKGTPAGSPSGGETRWLIGTNFQNGATVTIGGAQATVTNVSQRYKNYLNSTAFHILEIVTPPGVSGMADVTIRNPDGQSATVINAFAYVSDGQPFIGRITVNDMSWDTNGSTSKDGRITVPPSGFEINIDFDDYSASPQIDFNSLVVTANVALAGIPQGSNLASLFTSEIEARTYPTRATFKVESKDAFPERLISLTARISNGTAVQSPPATFSFNVMAFTETSNEPLADVQTWYLEFGYPADLKAYGLSSNALPTTQPELFVNSTLDNFVLRETRRIFGLDPVSGLPLSGESAIPNIRIEPGPPPGPVDPASGTFSYYHIGGNASDGITSGVVPGAVLLCGNNRGQEDYVNGFTEACWDTVVEPGSFGTFLNDDTGSPLYASDAVFAPLLSTYDANANPMGGPPGESSRRRGRHGTGF